jgi:hypothetical protein
MFNRYYPLAHVKVEFAKFSTREEKNRSLVQILLTDPELASKEPWSYLF